MLNVTISGTVQAGAQMQFVAFIEADICNRIASLRVLYCGTLKYVLKVNILNVSVSKMMRSGVEMRYDLEFYIFHRMASQRLLCSVALT